MEQCNRYILSSLHTPLWPSLHIQYSTELYGLQEGNTFRTQSTVIATDPCFENNVELYYFRDFVSGLCWLYRFTINLLTSSPPELLI